MKVLLLVDTLEIGGAERSLYELCRRFRTVEPVICHVYRGDALRGLYEKAGLRVVGLGLPGRYSPLSAMREILRLIRQERPRVIHGTLFRAGLLARAAGRRTRLPVIDSLVNDSYSRSRWRGLGPLARAKLAAVREIDRRTAPWVTHFIANSETVKQAAVRQIGLDAERVTVIHRGRDPRRFSSVSAERSQRARLDLGVPDRAPLLLNVGRLIERKGQAELIHAFAEILVAEPGARLALAGTGPDRAALESLAERTGVSARVLFLGDRSDIPDLLAACDVFLFPSHYEGLPGALVEAMLAAAPIVASDTAVHRECLGDAGLRTPVGDPAAIAGSVLELLRSPELRERLAADARGRARRLFDIEAAAARHEALYGQLSQDRSRG